MIRNYNDYTLDILHLNKDLKHNTMWHWMENNIMIIDDPIHESNTLTSYKHLTTHQRRSIFYDCKLTERRHFHLWSNFAWSTSLLIYTLPKWYPSCYLISNDTIKNAINASCNYQESTIGYLLQSIDSNAIPTTADTINIKLSLNWSNNVTTEQIFVRLSHQTLYHER